LSGVNREPPVFDFARIFEKPTLWWPGRTGAIAVIRATVTGTHKKAGLREPADGAAKVGTVDRKHLKLIARDPAYPARCIYSLSVGWHNQGAAKRSHPRLSLRKVADVSQAHPRKIAIPSTASDGGKKKARNRQGYYDRSESVEQDSQLHEESTSRKASFSGRGRLSIR
jgi:hypothetical protein